MSLNRIPPKKLFSPYFMRRDVVDYSEEVSVGEQACTSAAVPTPQLKDFLLCYYREVLRSMGTSLLNSERLPVINLSILQSSMNLAFQSSALTSEHCILLLLHSRSPTSGPLSSLPLPPPHYRKHFTPWELWCFHPVQLGFCSWKFFFSVSL